MINLQIRFYLQKIQLASTWTKDLWITNLIQSSGKKRKASLDSLMAKSFDSFFHCGYGRSQPDPIKRIRGSSKTASKLRIRLASQITFGNWSINTN